MVFVLLGAPLVSVAMPAGDEIRWGGVIRAVQWQGDDARVVVARRELKRSGKPARASLDGFFIVDIEDVKRPRKLRPGRRLTADGTLSGVSSVALGDGSVEAPVLDDAQYRTWAREPEANDDRRRRFAASQRFAYGGFYARAYPYRSFAFSPYRYGRFGAFRGFGRSRLLFY